MARRQRVYITRGVYSSTPFTGCTAVAGASEKERKSELGLGDAARGLVYSRASDDNVHAALNLPLLPPSSRELGRGGFPLFFFIVPFYLCIISYSIPSVVRSRVLRRAALRPPRLLLPSPFSFSSPSFVSAFYFFFRLFALTLYAPVTPLDSRRKYNSRDTSSHTENGCLCTDN